MLHPDTTFLITTSGARSSLRPVASADPAGRAASAGAAYAEADRVDYPLTQMALPRPIPDDETVASHGCSTWYGPSCHSASWSGSSAAPRPLVHRQGDRGRRRHPVQSDRTRRPLMSTEHQADCDCVGDLELGKSRVPVATQILKVRPSSRLDDDLRGGCSARPDTTLLGGVDARVSRSGRTPGGPRWLGFGF